jgi:uncharacterized RDD family membrane protein YckC/type II secretory pathway pseudopilin PulG
MSATAKSPWNPPKAPLVAESDDAPIYAGFWRRWAAAVIDGILYYIVAIAIALALGDGLGSTALAIAAAWLYHALMQSSSRQATLGKMALGIKVTSVDGERISFLRATGRYFSTLRSSLLLMIGYLMAAFTQRKQALHDLIAGTLVVRADASPDEVQTGSGTMKISGVVIAFGVLLAFVPVLGIVAAISIPAYQDYVTRAKMSESVATGTAAKLSVQEYFAANRKLPATLEETGFTLALTQNVESVRATFTGPEVVIRVHPRLPQAKGGALLFKAPAAQPTTWTCSADGIPNKYLPANCRG